MQDDMLLSLLAAGADEPVAAPLYSQDAKNFLLASNGKPIIALPVSNSNAVEALPHDSPIMAVDNVRFLYTLGLHTVGSNPDPADVAESTAAAVDSVFTKFDVYNNGKKEKRFVFGFSGCDSQDFNRTISHPADLITLNGQPTVGVFSDNGRPLTYAWLKAFSEAFRYRLLVRNIQRPDALWCDNEPNFGLPDWAQLRAALVADPRANTSLFDGVRTVNQFLAAHQTDVYGQLIVDGTIQQTERDGRGLRQQAERYATALGIYKPWIEVFGPTSCGNWGDNPRGTSAHPVRIGPLDRWTAGQKTFVNFDDNLPKEYFNTFIWPNYGHAGVFAGCEAFGLPNAYPGSGGGNLPGKWENEPDVGIITPGSSDTYLPAMELAAKVTRAISSDTRAAWPDHIFVPSPSLTDGAGGVANGQTYDPSTDGYWQQLADQMIYLRQQGFADAFYWWEIIVSLYQDQVLNMINRFNAGI